VVRRPHPSAAGAAARYSVLPGQDLEPQR
jgi:hypothetical protein